MEKTTNNHIKKILFIKNFKTSYIDISKLKHKINISYIESKKLEQLSKIDLIKLIFPFDIIIIGGGPQHLTNELKLNTYLIKQIKIIKLAEKMNKILIGICLGCQLIALTFGLKIIKMNELCMGFNLLNCSSLNTKLINEDKYLKMFNYKLLSNALSYHYDCIKFKNNAYLDLIASSKLDIPYIIKHKEKQIYGFQTHPEATFLTVYTILSKFLNKDICNQVMKFYNYNVYVHFFEVFSS